MLVGEQQLGTVGFDGFNFPGVTIDGRNPKQAPQNVKTLVNNEKNYQPQLVKKDF